MFQNKQELSDITTNLDYNQGIVQTVMEDLWPMDQKIETLKNVTARLKKVNQLWATNFKCMKSTFAQLSKKVLCKSGTAKLSSNIVE